MFSAPFKSKAIQAFLSRVGWLAGGEMLARISRLAAAVFLARHLTPLEFGAAALAITTFELVRLFNQNGVGAAVIAAKAEDLPGLCRTAHLAGWLTTLILFLAQTLVAWLVAKQTGRADIGWMIFCLGGVYWFMPMGVVHGWMLHRRQAMKRMAVVNATQVSTDNILTAVFAIMGFGPWAIVLPKLLTAPIWLIGVMWGRPWRPDRTAAFASPRTLAGFALPVLATEMMNASRLHLDKLIISAVFGLEVLGIYYFAFNAGLGLSSALTNAYNNAFFPYLCEAARKTGSALEAFDKAMRTAGLGLCAVLLIQALAVPIYVPLIFGEDWAFAVPLVVILCLGGPAKVLADSCGLLLRASEQPRMESLAIASVTAVTLGALFLGVQMDLQAACLALTAGATLAAITILPVSRNFARPSSTPRVITLEEARS